MRDKLARWAEEYPSAVAQGDEAFTGSPVAEFVRRELPDAIKEAIPGTEDEFLFRASAGQGGWAHTSWVAVLYPVVTGTVQDGFYVVYLLSVDGTRLYLSLNQGCTMLMNAVGIPGAAKELHQRADLMRARVEEAATRLGAGELDLQSSLWRGRLYEAGNVVSVEYDTSHLPAESVLTADLQEALRLYRTLRLAGAWVAEEDMLRDAQADGLDENITIEQAKRYRLHKHIERRAGHARIVKQLLGTRCMGCNKEMEEVYGSLARGLIHAHHLAPLSSLDMNQKIKLNPKKDFAVLCPNCHSVIHRMTDVSDLKGLRALVAQ
jgi:5-methylcytosine-specific restriction enzyme A